MARKLIIMALAGAIAFTAAGLLSGFVPQQEGPYLRRKVAMHVAEPGPEDMPSAPAADEPLPPWQVHGPVSSNRNSPEAGPVLKARKTYVSFNDDSVFLATEAGLRPMDSDFSAEIFDPLLPAGHASGIIPLAAPVPAEFGEALDSLGRPLRFAEVKIMLDPDCSPPDEPAIEEAKGLALTSSPLPVRIYKSLVGLGTFERARLYKNLVKEYAARYNLKENLIYAIIHNESNFSPVLVSSRSATGLMQLLPSTAAGEIHKFIYGRTGSITAADLSDPAVNIRFGTAYLHLLLNRYLGNIENETSREYCAIASYNMGPNRFLRLFSPNKEKAVEIINNMSSEEVYSKLTSNLPIAETRFFVAKVVRSKGQFASFE